MSWEVIVNQIRELKLEFANQTKRAIKRIPPRQLNTRRNIAENLINIYNRLEALIRQHWPDLSDEHRNDVKKEHYYFRDRFLLALFNLKLEVQVK